MSDLTPREPVAPMSVREFARKTGLCTATAHRVLAGEELSLSNARAAHPFLKKCPCCGQAALDAVRAEERERCKPKVKPLEWDVNHASTEIGLYAHYKGFPHEDGDIVVQLNEKIVAHAHGTEEAKAAAQADYERRILSALEAGHE